jgi:hypothetical protein
MLLLVLVSGGIPKTKEVNSRLQHRNSQVTSVATSFQDLLLTSPEPSNGGLAPISCDHRRHECQSRENGEELHLANRQKE